MIIPEASKPGRDLGHRRYSSSSCRCSCSRRQKAGAADGVVGTQQRHLPFGFSPVGGREGGRERERERERERKRERKKRERQKNNERKKREKEKEKEGDVVPWQPWCLILSLFFATYGQSAGPSVSHFLVGQLCCFKSRRSVSSSSRKTTVFIAHIFCDSFSLHQDDLIQTLAAFKHISLGNTDVWMGARIDWHRCFFPALERQKNKNKKREKKKAKKRTKKERDKKKKKIFQ